MLVYTFLKKTAFFRKYKRQREIVIEEEQDCPGEQEKNGIWDVLGFYDWKNKTVYICEPKICKISREISEKIKKSKNETYFRVRELVRLHEYAHAFIHRSRFPMTKRNMDEWYKRLGLDIEEPLAELITILSLNHVEDENEREKYEEVFYKIDERAPRYYQRWKELNGKIEDIRKEFRAKFGENSKYTENIFLLTLVISSVKRDTPKDFEDLLKSFEERMRREREELICEIVAAVV